MENNEIPRFNVGRKIARMREMRDLSQMELAVKMNFSQQFISKVENGYMLTEEEIELFARTLGFHKQAVLSLGDDKYVTYIDNFHCQNYHAIVVAEGIDRPAIAKECEAVYARMVNDYQRMLELMEKFKTAASGDE